MFCARAWVFSGDDAMSVSGCVVYFDDFRALVDRSDYEKIVMHNDDGARLRVADALDGVDLYFHIGPHLEGDVVGVTVAELIVHRIIPRITLHKDD